MLTLHRRQSGFTVLEAMAGIVLFAFVMPVIISNIIQIGRISDRAADLTRANILAERQLETVRSIGFNGVADGVYDFSGELDVSFTDPRVANYTVTTTSPGVKLVGIYISYTDFGETRELKYDAIITELGVAQ